MHNAPTQVVVSCIMHAIGSEQNPGSAATVAYIRLSYLPMYEQDMYKSIYLYICVCVCHNILVNDCVVSEGAVEGGKKVFL